MTAPGRAQDPGPAVAGAESTAGHLPVTRRRRYGGRFRSDLRLVLTDRGLAGAYGSRSFNKLPVNLKLPAHKKENLERAEGASASSASEVAAANLPHRTARKGGSRPTLTVALALTVAGSVAILK